MIWAAGLIIVIFLSGLCIPAGVLLPIFYVIPIVIALRFLQPLHFVHYEFFSSPHDGGPMPSASGPLRGCTFCRNSCRNAPLAKR